MDANDVFTAIPCLACADYKREKVLALLGAYWLASSQGQTPPVPTRVQLLQGCCQAARLLGDEYIDRTVAHYIVPDTRERMAMETAQAASRKHSRWR
jgi:hypothetical protein